MTDTHPRQHKAALLISYGVWPEVATELATRHDLDEIERAIAHVMGLHGTVCNVPGYIVAVLEGGNMALDPEQIAKARLRRALERSRQANAEREAQWREVQQDRTRRKQAVDVWIASHPEEYAAILARKRQEVPDVLTGKSAESLAERLARNEVYRLATHSSEEG